MTATAAQAASTPEPFAARTTLGVGGAPQRWLRLDDPMAAAEALLTLWAEEEPWLLVGGGSNLLVADAGFDGSAVLMATRGIEVLDAPAASAGDPSEAHAPAANRVRLRVQAGEPWDELVAFAVAEGFSGIEALSGIPGTVGAAPVQNIGAYGQEVASTLAEVEFLDAESGALQRLRPAELGLGYRDSVFKRGRRGAVLSVTLELERAGAVPLARSQPIGYAQLAAALGVSIGTRVPLDELRAAVLELRAAKGMLLDPADADTASAGSFFVNPIVSEAFARALPAAAPRWPTTPEPADTVIPLDAVLGIGGAGSLAGAPGAEAQGEAEPQAPARFGGEPRPPIEYRVKLSAAWLIEQAGIARGFALPGSRAAISSKHTLALTNRGGASAAEVAELARYAQARVAAEFGVELQPEPQLVGFSL